jgi:hypothetical protein
MPFPTGFYFNSVSIARRESFIEKEENGAYLKIYRNM